MFLLPQPTGSYRSPTSPPPFPPAHTHTHTHTHPPTLLSAVQTGPTPVYATTQEAKDAFKQLLTDVAVTGSMTWDETMRVIAQDRWGAAGGGGDEGCGVGRLAA